MMLRPFCVCTCECVWRRRPRARETRIVWYVSRAWKRWIDGIRIFVFFLLFCFFNFIFFDDSSAPLALLSLLSHFFYFIRWIYVNTAYVVARRTVYRLWVYVSMPRVLISFSVLFYQFVFFYLYFLFRLCREKAFFFNGLSLFSSPSFSPLSCSLCFLWRPIVGRHIFFPVARKVITATVATDFSKCTARIKWSGNWIESSHVHQLNRTCLTLK